MADRVPIIISSINPFDELLANIGAERSLEISPDEFTGVGISHPLFNTMRWYFKSKNAVCLTTGISLRKNMGKKYELERDHIFPWSALRDNGYGVLPSELTTAQNLRRSLFFSSEEKVSNFSQASSCDIELFKKFYNAMLKKGIYLAPSAYEAGFLSIAHSDEDITKTIETASSVFSSL